MPQMLTVASAMNRALIIKPHSFLREGDLAIFQSGRKTARKSCVKCVEEATKTCYFALLVDDINSTHGT
jgi:hypothetical protein